MISLRNKLFISASALFLVMGTVSHQVHASRSSFTLDDAYKIYKNNPGGSGNGQLSWPVDGVSGEGLKKIIAGIDRDLMKFEGTYNATPRTIKSGEEFKPALKMVVQCFAKKLVDALYETHKGNEADVRFATLKKANFVMIKSDIKDLDTKDLNLVFFTHIFVDIDGDQYSAFNRATSTAIAKKLKEENPDEDDLASAIESYLKIAQNAFQESLEDAKAALSTVPEFDRLMAVHNNEKLAFEAMQQERDELEKALKKSLRKGAKAREASANLDEQLQELKAANENLNRLMLQVKIAGTDQVRSALNHVKGLLEKSGTLLKSPTTNASLVGDKFLEVSGTYNLRLQALDLESEESLKAAMSLVGEQAQRAIESLQIQVGVHEETIREQTRMIKSLESDKSQRDEDLRMLSIKLQSTEEELKETKRKSEEKIHALEQETARVEHARLILESKLQVESEELRLAKEHLAQTMRTLGTAETAVLHADTEIKQLKKSVLKISGERDESAEELRKSEESKERLEADIVRLEERIRISFEANTVLEQELRETHAKLLEAKTNAEDRAQTLLEQDDELQKIKRELRNKTDAAGDLEEDKKELEEQVKRQKQLVKDREEEITDLRAELDEREEDVRQMQVNIDRIVLENSDQAREIRDLTKENATLKSTTGIGAQALLKVQKVKAKRDEARREKVLVERDKLIVEGERDDAIIERDDARLKKKAVKREKALVERDKLIVEGERDDARREKALVERDKLVVEGERDDAIVERDDARREKALVEWDKLVVEGERDDAIVERDDARREKALVEHDLVLEQRAHGQLQHDKGIVDNDLVLEQRAHLALQAQHAQLLLQFQQMQAQMLLLQAQVPVAPVFTIQELQENAKWQAVYDHLQEDTATLMSDGSYVKKDKAGKLLRWLGKTGQPHSFEGSFILQSAKAPTIVYK